jgi:hypothetical protein
LIDEGDPALGVPEYNGGLFDPEEHPFLEEHAVADAFLAMLTTNWHEFLIESGIGCR